MFVVSCDVLWSVLSLDHLYMNSLCYCILVAFLAQREKRSTDLMFMLGLNETINQLAMANRARWNSRVENRGWSHLEKGIRF